MQTKTEINTKKILVSFLILCSTHLWSQNQLNINKDSIKLNKIQIIGSHNSYKIGIEKPLFDFLLSKNPSVKSLEYEHIPLEKQLNLGLRSLELDIFHDPEGGYYSYPKGLDIVKQLGFTPREYDDENKLNLPGLKVFHIQDIDFRSHNLLFKDALLELEKWSKANSGHLPVIITMNTKDSNSAQTRKPLPFDAEALSNIDKEIKIVFSKNQLITPDFVRGNYKTLEKAILSEGWPLIDEVRNRFLFVLDEGEEKIKEYLSVFPNLKGAVLFINQEEGHPNAAFRIINNPIKNHQKIKTLVKQGYMVRTRADANTEEARGNNYQRFERAKTSGAQIITTDYYLPSTYFKSNYKVIFDDGKYVRLKK
ncbi:MAG: hypothetical protein GVY05_09475 [Bacteroidetes bacterium]|nr:hypothetical protein [Bacteroidota bacterium]